MPGRFRVRRLVRASVASIAVLALGACGTGPSAPDASAAGSKKIDMSGFAGQKLDYLYFTDGPDEQATRDLIKGFEKATGATVELQVVAFADLERQLQARIASKTPPSVARVAHRQPYPTRSWT
jgi:alpha-1,4-digalacturonate transport system substrate-binding protein